MTFLRSYGQGKLESMYNILTIREKIKMTMKSPK